MVYRLDKTKENKSGSSTAFDMSRELRGWSQLDICSKHDRVLSHERWGADACIFEGNAVISLSSAIVQSHCNTAMPADPQ